MSRSMREVIAKDADIFVSSTISLSEDNFEFSEIKKEEMFCCL